MLLLAGQQAAITHALTHAHGNIATSAQNHRTAHGGADSRKAPGRYSLCDFDMVFSQVLGAVHAAPLALPGIDDTPQLLPAYGLFRLGLTEVPYSSRGPPALS